MRGRAQYVDSLDSPSSQLVTRRRTRVWLSPFRFVESL